jgi:2-pyrone-4,6-dicarboxylate lactonase
MSASGAFVMDPDWVPFHPSPSKPAFRLPPGAVDAHCHVFGPGRVFPFAAERRYTPCDAPKERLFALRDLLGFSRNVIVQGTCHGSDNRAMVDALQASSGRARGVATVERGVSDAELRDLDAAGVRGIRFNYLRRLAERPPDVVVRELAERVRRLGWHVVVYFEAPDLPEIYELLAGLPTPVVVDHMGRPDVSRPVDNPEFELFLRLLRENGHVWSKVSGAERLSVAGPDDYADVAPFSRAVVETCPDRVLWGTDWPHPNMRSRAPDDGKLVDTIPGFAPTADLQRRLLVANPMRLYWPEEAAP